jgi:hypothetical protein
VLFGLEKIWHDRSTKENLIRMSAENPVQKTDNVSSDSEHDEGIKKRTHKYNLTPAEIQRQQLEKLLKRVDKPVNIPEMVDKPKLKPPKDIVRNVQGNECCNNHFKSHLIY